MSWFDPPTPPDPIRTASAATATNVSTSVANAYLNNINQVTPTGQLRYDPTGKYNWTDPTTNQTYEIPTFTATQLLSPNQLKIQQGGEAAQINMANMANVLSGQIGAVLGNPFDPDIGNFDAKAYLAANPDVAAAAQAQGADPNQFAAQHYRQFGQQEGHYGGGFDAQAYLNANPDVAAAARQLGMDPQVFAAQHYQNLGRFEGRTGGVGSPQRGDVNLLNQVGYAEGGINAPGAEWMRWGFDPAGSQQYGFGDAGNITRSYGPADSFGADRSRIEQSMFERLNPQLDRERANLEQRLQDQGIRYGSAAYTNAMDDYNRQTNDMRLAITAQGGAEQQRLMDMAAQQAGFQNAAQQQAYTQAQGRGQFYNQAQAAQFGQNIQGAQFANQAQQQLFNQQAARTAAYNSAQAQNLARNTSIFNAQNEQRQNYLNEQYAQRNQPLNEISALLSGSQVSQPNFIRTPTNQIATTDIAGLINNNFNQQLANFQQQSQNANQLIGGIFGAIGGLGRGGAFNGLLSDRTEKENIKPIGSIYAAGPEGEKPLPIYQYAYKDDPASMQHIGPMAQDVEKVDKSAVKTIGGKKYIDKTKLGSILKVA